MRLLTLGRLNAELNGARDFPRLDAKECYRTSDMTWLDHERRETVEALHDFRDLAQNRLQFLDARVNRSGFFEGQLGGRRLALVRELTQKRIASAVEVILDTLYFRGVVLIGAALKTRGKTHLHFGIDAAGKLRVRMKIVHASPHLE